MKWSELRKIAEDHGWYLAQHGAKHDKYLHPNRSKDDVLLLGRHGKEEIKNGTFYKLKKQIGF